MYIVDTWILSVGWSDYSKRTEDSKRGRVESKHGRAESKHGRAESKHGRAESNRIWFYIQNPHDNSEHNPIMQGCGTYSTYCGERRSQSLMPSPHAAVRYRSYRGTDRELYWLPWNHWNKNVKRNKLGWHVRSWYLRCGTCSGTVKVEMLAADLVNVLSMWAW